MKGKRRRARQRASKQNLPRAAQVVAFTEAEEAFFRAGETIETVEREEEPEPPRMSWLSRLFSRALPA